MKIETNILVAVVRKAALGDQSAQGVLYGQFARAMFNICLRITGQREDAEDVLQESFVLGFRNLGQLKQEQNFGGWLKRIVINECIRYSKKKIRWREIDEGLQEIPDEEEAGWMEFIPITRINDEIGKLPDACRTVFTLYAIEDLPHREIAESLGISESTSKSQYHRARQLLKNRLTKTLING